MPSSVVSTVSCAFPWMVSEHTGDYFKVIGGPVNIAGSLEPRVIFTFKNNFAETLYIGYFAYVTWPGPILVAQHPISPGETYTSENDGWFGEILEFRQTVNFYLAVTYKRPDGTVYNVVVYNPIILQINGHGK